MYLNLGYNIASKKLGTLSVVELRTLESDQYLFHLHTNKIVRFPQACTMKKVENRRLLQDRGILSRIFETAATARPQVGVMLVHER